MLGFGEIIFIVFLLVLLVWGPKRLPEWGKSLGQQLKKWRDKRD